jgi:hypothetical protein
LGVDKAYFWANIGIYSSKNSRGVAAKDESLRPARGFKTVS